jgi:hypothetical protein
MDEESVGSYASSSGHMIYIQLIDYLTSLPRSLGRLGSSGKAATVMTPKLKAAEDRLNGPRPERDTQVFLKYLAVPACTTVQLALHLCHLEDSRS